MSASLRAVGVVAVAVLLAIATVPGAAAQDEEPRERVVVELEADGDAVVTTVSIYDLTSDADREAFAAVEDRRDALSTRYADRLSAIAEQVSAETGREMAIRDATATVERSGDVGVVRLSATWTNLAATDGDDLVLATPFDEGFAPDRPLVVRAPDGHEIESAAVQPTSESGDQATWSADQDLSGFRTTVSATDGGSNALAPSLAVPAVGLVLSGGLLALRRRRSH